MIKREIDLEKATIPFIEKNFKHWSWQMPSYSYVCDFMGINHQGAIIAIEYKLKDWKRAIEQTRHFPCCVDFVYILLQGGSWIDKAIHYIQGGKYKTGILFFDGTVNLALKPKWQTMIWEPSYRQTRKWIKEISLHKRD